MPLRLHAYYVFSAVAGLAAAVAARSELATLPVGEIVALTIIYAGLNLPAVRLPGGMRITPGYPLVVTAVVVYGPMAAILTATAGFLARMVANRDHPLHTAYCIGQVSASAYAASLVRQIAGGGTGPLALPSGVFWFLVVAFAFDITNIGFASGRVALEQGGSWTRRWLRGIFVDRGWVLPVYHALGLVTVLLTQAYGYWGLVVACLPPVGLFLFLRLHAEVTETRAAAVNDRLTGVGNFRHLSGNLAREFERAVAQGRPLGLVWIDVDQLKAVNDANGHEAGNEVLRSVATAIQMSIRPGDDVARLGGDEFVVLLANTDLRAAQAAAQRVMEVAAAQVVEYQGQTLRPSISAGAASAPESATSAEQLLAAADQAMYQVKEARRAMRVQSLRSEAN